MKKNTCSNPATHGRVLKVDRQSDELTYLRCVSCDEIICWWENYDKSKKMTVDTEVLEQLR